MLLSLLLATSVTIQPIADKPGELHLPYLCRGHWQSIESLKGGPPGDKFQIMVPHVKVFDRSGAKVGETDDKGGIFACVTDTNNDGDDDGENI